MSHFDCRQKFELLFLLRKKFEGKIFTKNSIKLSLINIYSKTIVKNSRGRYL